MAYEALWRRHPRRCARICRAADAASGVAGCSECGGRGAAGVVGFVVGRHVAARLTAACSTSRARPYPWWLKRRRCIAVSLAGVWRVARLGESTRRVGGMWTGGVAAGARSGGYHNEVAQRPPRSSASLCRLPVPPSEGRGGFHRLEWYGRARQSARGAVLAVRSRRTKRRSLAMAASPPAHASRSSASRRRRHTWCWARARRAPAAAWRQAGRKGAGVGGHSISTRAARRRRVRLCANVGVVVEAVLCTARVLLQWHL